MVSLGMLWLPILVAGVVVFIGSFVMNTVLPHHRTDYSPLPDEDRIREALKGLEQHKEYLFPYAVTPAEMKDPAYAEKVKSGPVGMLVLWPNTVGPSGKQLGQHFVLMLAITLMAGYVASAAVPAGADYLKVFQVVGATAWLGHSGALFLNSIWYHLPWSNNVKFAVDGLVYALLTAGVFGWLWP